MELVICGSPLLRIIVQLASFYGDLILSLLHFGFCLTPQIQNPRNLVLSSFTFLFHNVLLTRSASC
jgi:hypothetical protein